MGKFLFGICLGLFVPMLGALLAARLGWFSVSATQEPPAWETRLARMAVEASIGGSAQRLSRSTVVKDEELMAGMKLYRNNCGGCHGEASRPSPWGIKGFYPRVPQFGQSPPRKPDWQMFWIVRHGIRYSGMGAWSEEMLSDQQAWEIVVSGDLAGV